MRIYVASSWRNPYQPGVVELLRECGHEVYDFRHPMEGDSGFSWREVDDGWTTWTATKYREALRSPPAQRGFKLDFDAMQWADAFVLVQPCGRSAHLELGWAVGAGKVTAVYFPDEVAGPGAVEPELMARLAGVILVGAQELRCWGAIANKIPVKRMAFDDLLLGSPSSEWTLFAMHAVQKTGISDPLAAANALLDLVP